MQMDILMGRFQSAPLLRGADDVITRAKSGSTFSRVGATKSSRLMEIKKVAIQLDFV